mmetsp:Transcript_56347/g.159941  ORF Transcript_56347/g.159941 Transcript_56347/m.159941 type:complete len:217 (+) Transcript_56347:4824-5474(+)
MLSDLNQAREEVLVVCDVEISSEQQAARHPVAFPKNGVAPVDAVVAVGAVADVREEELAGKRNVLLDPGRVDAPLLLAIRLFRLARLAGGPLELLAAHALDPLEDVLDRIRDDGLLAGDVPRARWYVQLHVGNAAAVLSAVALLLHHQVHPVEAEEVCAILLLIVLKWFQQAQQRESALVMGLVTHGGLQRRDAAPGEGLRGARAPHPLPPRAKMA